MTYEEWYDQVNEMFVEYFGLQLDDCGDWQSRDAYDSDFTVEQGFNEAVLTFELQEWL
jgi:hypothetical protein